MTRTQDSINSLQVESQSFRNIEALEPQLLAQQTGPRKALIIGNALYTESELNNPVNDATDVAQVLESLSFEVTLHTDVKWREMDIAIEEFSKELTEGGVGIFYYAGHGVAVDGENYLVPIDAQLERERDVRNQAIALGEVLHLMEQSGTDINVLMIDACRDNPFYRRWRSGRRGVPIQRGLAGINNPAVGTVISFATGLGNFADDGEGRNSPYTSHLLKHISEKGQDIRSMLQDVREGVYEETNQQQIPWVSESLIGNFSFNPNPSVASTTSQSGSGLNPEPLLFSDIEGNIYRTQIAQASSLGLLRTEQGEPFRPEDPITREELTSMTARALEGGAIQRDQALTAPYPDVDVDRWSSPAIAYAKEAGLIAGYSNGTFRPTQTVTRAELIAMLLRISKLNRLNFGPSIEAFPFSDMSGHWAEDLIAELSNYCGFVASPLNESGSAFSPDSTASRSYAAAAITRLLACSVNSSSVDSRL
ncbi:MAG: caspase family protein [Cyanobacteria bacterium P01_A01_bin.116]